MQSLPEHRPGEMHVKIPMKMYFSSMLRAKRQPSTARLDFKLREDITGTGADEAKEIESTC